MNEFYNNLNVGQIDNIYKNRKKQTGKYLAMWCESGHLDTYMVTLSPSINNVETTIKLRNEFIKKLNAIKNYQKADLAYFSAIEVKVNVIPLNEETEEFEKNRMSNDDINWHCHIQLLTSLLEEDIQKALDRVDCSLSSYKHLTPPQKELEEDEIYDYVIKDLKSPDFKAHYYRIEYAKNKNLYSSSRKKVADYLVKKLWNYMDFMYPDKWSKIDNKYGFILDLKESEDILFGNVNNNNITPDGYDRVIVKDKTIDIKKNIFSKTAP